MNKITNYLSAAFDQGTNISRFNIFYASIIGASGHFFLFFIYRYIFHIHWENLPTRIIGVILCIGAIIKLKKPHFLGRFFGIYWHFMLIYVLPFIITLFALKNNFEEPWLYWEIFMVFVLISFVPHWLMFFFDLLAGIAFAVTCYMLTTPWETAFQPVSFNIPLYGVVVAFSIFAGYLFNYSNLQGMRAEEQHKAAEKTMALKALSGSIAHEMRNPLSQIRYNIDEVLNELSQCDTANSVNTASPRSIEIINKRLSQAQMAVNRGLHVITMTLGNFRTTDVPREELTCLSAMTVTRKAIEEYGYATEQEKHMIYLQPGDDFIFLGEENNYILLLYNLLVNSLHFLHSIPGGKIEIRLTKGAQANYIFIRDNGPGISAKILPRIFEPFFTSGKKDGTGLGLAFCKRVMYSFNGEITCISEELKYTEFILKFPVPEQATISEYKSKLYKEYSAFFADKRVLIAGIPEVNLPLFRRLLAPLRIIKDEASDGNETLKMIEENRYDLVLANTNLTQFSIDDLLKKIKTSQRNIPVIACSSSKNPVINNFGGADALISIPPALPELLSAMKNALDTVRETLKKSVSGKTVVVADDLDANRKVIKSMLNKLGVTILEANNGLEALALLESQSCDLLIIDLRMPVLDGFDTAKRIRSADASYREIPILGLSGNLDNETLNMVSECGIDDSLLKPLKLKPFQEKVSVMLRISMPCS
jgi:two-component system CAI-1 autoinducer sensor kinase/phosphatase CqsS